MEQTFSNQFWIMLTKLFKTQQRNTLKKIWLDKVLLHLNCAHGQLI